MDSTTALVAPRSPNHQRTPPQLLDLLHLLSLDGFEASIWSRLTHQSRGSFNLTCRQSRQLVDQLVTSATLSMGSLSLTGPGSVWTTIEQFAAFLQRLPRLTTLHLHRTWPTEMDLVMLLEHCGAASNGRVTQATLYDEKPEGALPWKPQLFHGGLSALSYACPRLRELELVGPPDGDALELQSALFLPFRDGELVQLTTRNCSLSKDALVSLRGVTSLTSLRALRCTNTEPRQLQLLGEYPHLQHCEVELDEPPALGDLVALLDATRLTSLRVQDVAWYPGGDAWAADEADALAQLGGLVDLQSLDLGRRFRVDDAALAALGRLTQLTRLCVGGIACKAPVAAGRLPQLQVLQLGGEDEAVTPSALLGSLLPLLPLASLTTLGSGTLVVDVGVDVEEDFDADDQDAAAAAETAAAAAATAVQAAALHSVMQHLAAAPRLAQPTQAILQAVKGQRHLGLDQIADSLQPAAAHLHTLALWGVDLAAVDWDAVQQRLPHLTKLRLDDQNSDSVELVAVVRHLTRLEGLELYFNSMVGPHVDRMWLGLAWVCERPLRVDGDFQVPEAVMAECREVQARVNGAQLITWPCKEGQGRLAGGQT